MLVANPLSSELRRDLENLHLGKRKAEFSRVLAGSRIPGKNQRQSQKQSDRSVRPTRCPTHMSSVPFEIGIGLDLDQDLGRDQSAYLHHRRCWTNIAEKLSMRFADFLPLRDVRHKHARADDILHARAGLQ